MENKELQIISQALPPGLTVNATTSITEIVKMDVPAISSLNAGKTSPDAGIALFEAVLLDLSDFFGRAWEPERCYSVAQIMFGEYYYWTFAELKHFTTKMKAAQFGKIYGEFTPFYVTEAALNYNVALLEAREQKEISKSDYERQEVGEYSEETKRLFEETIANFKQMDEEEKESTINWQGKRHQERERKRDLLREYCKKEGLVFETVRHEYGL